MPKETINVTYWSPETYSHSGKPSHACGNFGIYITDLIEYLRESPITELINGDEEGKKQLGLDKFEALLAINDLSNMCKIAQMSSLEKSIEGLESKTSPESGPISLLRKFDETMKKIKDIGSRRKSAQPTKSQ